MAKCAITGRTVRTGYYVLVQCEGQKVFLSLAGMGLSLSDKLFLGWFGPRGLASVVFIVIVLNEHLPGGETLQQVVVWTVILSVIAHGLSANPLSSLYARRKNG